MQINHANQYSIYAEYENRQSAEDVTHAVTIVHISKETKLRSGIIPTSNNVNKSNANKEHDSQSSNQAEELVEAINKRLLILNSSLEFNLHEKTNRIYVNVVDRESGEIIRQVPPEKILDLLATMWSHSGVFVDETM